MYVTKLKSFIPKMFTQKIRAHVVLLAFKNHIPKDTKILDIGCGNGVISKLIRHKFKCNVLGVDVLDYAEGIDFKKIENPYKIPFKNIISASAVALIVRHFLFLCMTYAAR